MGYVDPGVQVAEALARLVSLPGVRTTANQLRGIIPQASGPFQLPSAPSSQHQSTGASFNLGQIAGHAAGQGVLGAIAALKNGSLQQQQPVDPLMQLYSQLIDKLQQPAAGPNPIDTQALMQQVQKAINPIYDSREQAATANTNRATHDVQNMYGQLSQDYQNLAPQQLQQAAAAQDQVKQLYGQLKSNIEGSYSRVAQEQGDLFNKLGIQAALPDVLAKQAPAVQQASIAADENQAQQQQRYMDMGQADSTYYREGAPNAVLRGNEVSTGMLNKLQDYINQAEGDRAAGIQTSYMDQLGQAQNQFSSAQNAANSETARRQDMLWQMLQSQIGPKQQVALTPDTFMGSLPQGIQQSVAGAFTQLQRSPEAIYGKVQDPRSPIPGTFVATTPQWYMQQADAMLQSGQIDAATHQALLMYIQLTQK